MNHELRFLTQKIEHALQFLDRARYYNLVRPKNMQFLRGKTYDISKLAPLSLGEYWGGYDQYAWVKIDFELPESYLNHPHKLAKLNFGTTGGGNNSGFESLAYLNGKIYQGVDTNHQELFLPPELQAGELKIFLWAGLDAGGGNLGISNTHQIHQIDFMLLDKPTDDLYYLFICALETLKYMSEYDPLYNPICDIIDDAFKQLPMSQPDGIRAKAAKVFDEAVEKFKAIPRADLVTVHTIGHTHIDVAWLWRLAHTREKVQRSFSTVLRLMERYPNYTFLQTQPQLYQYVKEDAPELYEDILTTLKTGRWEANGAMWIEADCNLTSGESLVRQLLYGKRFYQNELGQKSNCLWLPDVFGYSAALPQILAKSDIDYFMTTKISGNQYNRIPNDTFYWQGIDGSQVLAHFITTPSNFDSDWQSYTYSAEINGKSIQGIWRNYKNKQINQDLLMSYGFGDGGGGVNREMLERLDKLSIIPGNPKIKPGHAYEFFEQLGETIKDKPVPTWLGELYLEFHRGTYTSQAITKKYNRRLEFLLRNTEILASLYDSENYNQSLFDDAWHKLLTNQFHDILPGSSITQVYEDAEKTYAEIEIQLKDYQSTILKKHHTANDNSDKMIWTLFNYNSFKSKSIVFIETAEHIQFYDSQKVQIKAEKQKNGYALLVEIDPLSSIVVYGEVIPGNADASTFIRKNCQEIENLHYHIKWNSQGKITHIFDKHLQREMIKSGEVANDLTLYEDIPRMFDAWELEPYYEDKPTKIVNCIRSELIHEDSLLTIVEFEWQINQSRIIQKMILRADSARIDFDTEVDWHENEMILRTSFPLSIRQEQATFDIQYGNIKRATHKNTHWDFAKFEVCAHKWADLSQRDAGVAILNDSKYGYNVTPDTIGLSLLKSSNMPDKKADRGKQTFTYSFMSHANDWYEAEVEQTAMLLNNPIIVVQGHIVPKPAFIIDQPNIMLDAIKKAESGDGYIVRIHEFSGAQSEIKLIPNIEYSKWQLVNLMEIPEGDLSEGEIKLVIKPYEILTIKLV